jgi:hypothetical protein
VARNSTTSRCASAARVHAVRAAGREMPRNIARDSGPRAWRETERRRAVVPKCGTNASAKRSVS